MFTIEFVLLLIIVSTAFIVPNPGAMRLRRMESFLSAIARRQTLAVLMIGAAALLIRVALLPLLPIPTPGVHDEYSYLLQADTFAHGRLTNPTPPLSTYFDTFHVILHPTYASKFPPVQGLILAFGQVVFGHPWFGVLISMAAMCAALCWMVQGWLPPGWAFLGGVLAIIRLGTFSYWVNSYWGGAAAAFAGAIALGALARVIRRNRVRYVWLIGLSFAMLANTRPYEGLILAVPTTLVLLAWMFKEKNPGPKNVQPRKAAPKNVGPKLILQVAVPLVVCAVLTGAAMGYYDWKVTGNPTRLPYQVYMSQYDVSPLFLWQKARSPIPQYPEKYMREFYVSFEMAPYRSTRSLRGLLREMYLKIKVYDWFYLGPVLTFPLIALSWTLRDRRMRPLLLIGVVVLAGLLAETWSLPHYAAPATALLYVFVLQCLRHVRVWCVRHKPVGLMLSRAVPAICVIMLGVRMAAGSTARWTWYSNWPGNTNRAQMLDTLLKIPGRQLVIVRYAPTHSAQHEWVFNRADINSAHVIWARDEGDLANRALIRYYGDSHLSHVWLLLPDQTPPRLSPYSNPPSVAQNSPAGRLMEVHK